MNDNILHYIEKGTGFPLVLLHGNGESSDYFKNQIDCFSHEYRVIAVDTRGHGKSPRGTTPFTLSQFAEDLKSLVDSLNIKRMHLLGFSDGANISLLFALKYPSYIESLILNGANLTPKGVKLTVQIPICIGYGVVSIIAFIDRNAVAKKEMLSLMVKEPDIKTEELKALKSPVLVIVGTKDMIKDSHSKLIANSIARSCFVRIKGDHFIADKNSHDFNRAVLQFLKEKTTDE